MIGIPPPIISVAAGFDSPVGRARPATSSTHGKVCNRRSNPHLSLEPHVSLTLYPLSRARRSMCARSDDGAERGRTQHGPGSTWRTQTAVAAA